MSNYSKKDLEFFAIKTLENYDGKNPSIIFKEEINITNEDALIIQSNVARLREKRGEEIIGYKIGCVSKDTQKKMGFTQPACGYLWKSELYTSGIEPYGAELLANNAIHAGVVLGLEKKLPTNKLETDLKLIYDNEIIDTWVNKNWPVDMLSEVNWLVKEQAKSNNYLKKGDLILTGAYGFPVPINHKKIIEVTSSAFGGVKAIFN